MPSYGINQGFARNASQAEYPNLWRGLTTLFHPEAMGQVGTQTCKDVLSNIAYTQTTNCIIKKGTYGKEFYFPGSQPSVSNLSRLLAPKGEKTVICLFRCDNSNLSMLASTRDATSGFYFDVNRTTAGNLNVSYIGSSNITFAAGITVGSYYHAAFTVSGTTCSLYINGRFLGSGTGTEITGTGLSSIGTGGVFVLPLTGAIVYLLAYSRPLTSQEIMQSYMGASPLILKRENWQRAKYSGVFRHRTASRARQLMAA